MQYVPHYPDLAGKVVVITGGTKGIGYVTAQLLAASGAHVVINGRDPDATEAAAADIRAAGGSATGVAADASSREGVTQIRERAFQAHDRVHGLVAFAGGFGARTPLVEITDDEWDEVLRQNLTATFYALREFVPRMSESGGGSVVTMASNAARLALPPLTTGSYAAAKAGVVMLTRHAAQECGPAQVRINCVAPATTLSPRVEALITDEIHANIAAQSPLGRIGFPADTAHAAIFLLSDAASWVTGITLDIAGGRVML